jgi:hypothetical protein
MEPSVVATCKVFISAIAILQHKGRNSATADIQLYKEMALRNCISVYPQLQFFKQSSTFSRNVAPQLHIQNRLQGSGIQKVAKL